MKYIRMKDGRIMFGTPNDNDLTGVVLDYQSDEIVKIPIIAQADTIEELCDEFVIINPDIYEKPTLCYGDYDEYKDELHKEDILFGAIWTKKGLIYVAKLNKKGELELL